MTTYNHTAIVNGDARGNDAAIWNDPLGALDAAIGNRANIGADASIAAWLGALGADGVSGGNQAAKNAYLKTLIAAIGTGVANNEIETARQSGNTDGTTNASLSDRIEQVSGNGYHPMAYGANGDGATDDLAVFSTLINTTMQPTGGWVAIDREYYIDGNLSIPANVSLVFTRGGKLKVGDFSLNPGSSYEWNAATAGGSGVYKLEIAGGDPGLAVQPRIVYEGTTTPLVLVGTLPYKNTEALTNTSNTTEDLFPAGSWYYGDADSDGYSTIYVRLAAGGDPDSSTANTIRTGYIVTINGAISAPRQQIFSGPGAVALTAAHEVMPEWWGTQEAATAAERTPMMMKCFNSGALAIIMSNATANYTIDNTITLTLPTRVINANRSIIQCTDPDKHVLRLYYDLDYMRITGLRTSHESVGTGDGFYFEGYNHNIILDACETFYCRFGFAGHAGSFLQIFRGCRANLCAVGFFVQGKLWDDSSSGTTIIYEGCYANTCDGGYLTEFIQDALHLTSAADNSTNYAFKHSFGDRFKLLNGAIEGTVTGVTTWRAVWITNSTVDSIDVDGLKFDDFTIDGGVTSPYLIQLDDCRNARITLRGVTGGHASLVKYHAVATTTATGRLLFEQNRITAAAGTESAWTSNGGKIIDHDDFGYARKSFIPPSQWHVDQGAATLTVYTAGGLGRRVIGWALDKTTDEAVCTYWQVPSDYAAGAGITIRGLFAPSTGSITGTIRLETRASTYSNGEDISGAAILYAAATPTLSNTQYELIVAQLASATEDSFDTHLVAGDIVRISVNRDADAGSGGTDTYDADAIFLGCEIEYRAVA